MPASKSLRFDLSKDNTSRALQNNIDRPPNQGAGKEHHWIVGKVIDPATNRTDVYRVHAQIDEPDASWADVGRVISADLVVDGSHQHIDQGGNISRLWMRPISPGIDPWTEGTHGEDDFNSQDYINPRLADTTAFLSQQLDPDVVNRINVMGLLAFWAPSTVMFRIGGTDQAGGNHVNRGFRIWSDDESKSTHAFECSSIEATSSADRPYIDVTYEPRSTTPVASRLGPSGNVTDPVSFVIGFADDDPDQRISAYELEVQRVADGYSTWKPGKISATKAEQQIGAQGQCSLTAAPSKWGIGTPQEWRVRVWDNETKPVVSPWTAWGSSFTVIGGVPTFVTPLPAIGTVSKMAGVRFVASWTHPQGKAIASLRIQLRLSTPAGSPLWDGGDNAWDTGAVSPTAKEQSDRQLNRSYGGDSLVAGSYSWRVMVTDVLGAQSAWAYGTFTLSADYDVADPGAGDNVGYSRRLTGFRIILRKMGANRGPGALRAVIEDALNVGMSSYVSAPGECYFTLPATHPQVGECEPYKTHCSFEQYRNGAWQEIWAGVLTDFDATGDDVVINGIDYIGLLSLDMERRSKLDGDPKDKLPNYFQKTISYIIADQIDQARTTANSPTGFITRPTSGTGWNVMSYTVTIDGSYRQRLEFIRGLIDSYRAGSGIKSRLVCRRVQSSTADATHGYSYQWNLLADSGTNRPAMRLEWGGLIQGFRIQGFGDFAVKVLGVGREVNELKPHYKTGTMPVKSGDPSAESTWGNLAKTAVWQDIDDENDLARRVQQLATESGKIGKRMALGLRVRGIEPFDGWDLTDSVPIDIVRGVVDTGHYQPDPSGPTAGLSWWTIWGAEWRWYPDGHDEMTLVVKPREDLNTPDPDIVVGKPFVPTPEWTLAPGPPNVATMSAFSLYYLDTDTQDVYTRVDDPTTGAASYMLTAEGYQTTLGPTPDIPEGLTATAGFKLVGLTWARAETTNLGRYGVRWTRSLLDGTGKPTGVPDTENWTYLSAGVATNVVITDLVPDIPHYFEIRAVDREGYTVTSVSDPTPVLADANSEAGWGDMVNATPTLIGSEDMAVNSLVANFIDSGSIDAMAMTTGILQIGGSGLPPYLEVYNASSVLVAKIDSRGLVVIHPTDRAKAVWVGEGQVRVTDTLLYWDDPADDALYQSTDPTKPNYRPDWDPHRQVPDLDNTTWQTTVNAGGVNASAINYGINPGGHNNIPNAGFELAPFSSPTTKVWTSAADWATGTSRVNADVSTVDLKLTTFTY